MKEVHTLGLVPDDIIVNALAYQVQYSVYIVKLIVFSFRQEAIIHFLKNKHLEKVAFPIKL